MERNLNYMARNLEVVKEVLGDFTLVKIVSYRYNEVMLVFDSC